MPDAEDDRVVLCRYEHRTFPAKSFEPTEWGLVHKGVKPRHNSDGEVISSHHLPAAELKRPPDNLGD